MNPFALSSWLNILSAVVVFFCMVKILLRGLAEGKRNASIFYFFCTFLFVEINLLLMALPEIISKDGNLIQGVYIIAALFSHAAANYLAYTALILFFPYRQKFFLAAIWLPTLAFRMFSVIYSFNDLKPATRVIVGWFVNWQGASMTPSHHIIGSFWILADLLLFALLFGVKGWRHENSFIRQRSRFFVIGIITISVGWSAAQLFSFAKLTPGNYLLVSGFTSAILVNLGMILLLRGVLLREKPNITAGQQ